MATSTSKQRGTVSPELLLNRELSWLSWNARVLALASDASVPLLERTRICSFFSRNLDEFFMVRVAGLLDQVESGMAVTSTDGRTPQQALQEIRAQVVDMTSRQSKLWKRELSPALEEAGIVVGQVDDCTKDDQPRPMMVVNRTTRKKKLNQMAAWP